MSVWPEPVPFAKELEIRREEFLAGNCRNARPFPGPRILAAASWLHSLISALAMPTKLRRFSSCRATNKRLAMRLREPRSTYLLRRIVLSLPLLLIGCTGIPEAEFAAYLEAVSAARSVSETILVDYDTTRRSVDTLDTQSNSAVEAENSDPLADYDPNATNTSQHSIIDTRVQAWDAISRYNETLTALVSGESAVRLRKRMGTLVSSLQNVSTSLGTAITGFDVLLPTIEKFIVLAERARATSEFEEAIRRARPIIHEIITRVLIADTTTYAAEKGILLDDHLDKATRSMRTICRTMARIAREHAEPLANKHPEQVQRKSAVEQEMKDIIGAFGRDVEIKFDNKQFSVKESGLSNYPSPPDGLKPYSELVQSQLEQLLGKMREADELRLSQEQARKEYKSTLDSYVRILKKINVTMLAIELQLGKPTNLQSLVTEITALTIKLRSDIELLRKRELGALTEQSQMEAA